MTPQSTNRGAGAVIIRGFIGPENLILVDGLRFNQSTFRTGPNQYLDTLPLFALDSIEVVRGPNATLYGNGTIGGVVNARTSIGDDLAIARFIGDTAHGSANGSAFVSRSVGRLSLAAGLSHAQFGTLTAGRGAGTQARSEDQFFLSALQADGRFLASPFSQLSWIGSAQYQVSDRLTLTGTYLGSSVQNASRVDRIGQGEVRSYDNIDHFAYLQSQTTTPWVGTVNAAVVFHQTREFVERTRCLTQPSYDPATGEVYDHVQNLSECARQTSQQIDRVRENDDVVSTLGTSVVADRDLGPFNIIGGADLYADFVSSSRRDASAPSFEFEDAPRGNFSDESVYANMGLFAIGRYRLWEQKKHAIELHGGGRFEHVLAFAPDVPGLGDVDYNFSSLSGSAGVSYFLGLDAHVYLTWNQGFRAPNLQETTVLGDTGSTFEIPNVSLKPERADTIELGTRLRTPWFNVEPVLFATLLSDRIAREPATFDGDAEVDGKPVVQRVNRDSGYTYGAELSAESTMLYRTSIFTSFSAMDAAVTVDDDLPFDQGPLHDVFAGDQSYESFRRLAPVRYVIGLNLHATDTLTGSLTVRGAGSQRRLASGDRSDLRICEGDLGLVDATCDGTDPWATLNLSARYRLPAGSLQASFLNITDTRYRQHGSGVPGAGRSLRVDVTLRY